MQGRIWYRVWNGVERSGAELAERDGRDWVGKRGWYFKVWWSGAPLY